MNGINRGGDVTVERGVGSDYCVAVLRIPIEPKGTIFNFDEGKVIGSIGFTVYRYTINEYEKAEYFAYFGRQTNEDTSPILSKIKKLNGSSNIRVYSRISGNYIYVYVRPLNQYDVLTLQVNFASAFNFVELLRYEDKELYSDISSTLTIAQTQKTNITPNEGLGWKNDSAYVVINDIDYLNRVSLNFTLYSSLSADLSEGVNIATISNPPSKNTPVCACYQDLTTNTIGVCQLLFRTNGTVGLRGCSTLINKEIRVFASVSYYI